MANNYKGGPSDDREYNALYKAATAAQVVNIKMILPTISDTISKYLDAVFNQDFDALPMEHMEEEFFYGTQDGIEEDINSGIRRKVYTLQFSDLRHDRTDASNTHLVFRCVYYYDITYKAGEKGTAYDKSESRVCEFTFRHDPRMGWLLCGYEDLGPSKQSSLRTV